ncbi:MAG: transglycosylase SLT domain-containing protein [Acidimicrobiales bacterium]
MGRAAAAFLLFALVAACAHAAEPTAAPERPPLATTTTQPTTTTTAPPPTTTTTAPPTTTTGSEPVDVFALVPPAASRIPATLAKQIIAAEATIRSPSSSELETAQAALLQQVAYRQLGAHPEWDGVVAAALPEGLRAVARLQAAARREFRGMHTRRSSTLPAWRIVQPEPPDELLEAYRAAEAEFGIPWKYLAAINLVETGIGRIRGTSIAGAQGPMQFMPATWEAYGGGGDINDTKDAISAAARYLAANGGARDIAGALYRYNHSNRYVVGVQVYADLIAEHPRAFLGFYYWGVWYLTDRGDVYLPVGYEQGAPIPVSEYRP